MESPPAPRTTRATQWVTRLSCRDDHVPSRACLLPFGAMVARKCLLCLPFCLACNIRWNSGHHLLAAEHGIHPNQISTRKATALQGLPGLFERRDATAYLVAAHE